MKLVQTALILVLLSTAASDARAWFFFFLPASVTNKIGDALTGAEGENCVAATAKVGDILKSPNGNTATIKSLSGSSSRCQDERLPIRALLTFNYNFSSKAGIDIPDGFEQKPLTDTQRFLGNLLRAENASQKIGFFISSRGRDGSTDSPGIAQAIATRMIAALEEGKASNEEQLTINGMRAYRFEVAGKSKALFHPRFTYVVTMLEGQQELVVVSSWTPTDDFERNKESLRQLAFRISGINSPATEPAAAAGMTTSTPASTPPDPPVPASAPPSAPPPGPSASSASPAGSVGAAAAALSHADVAAVCAPST